MAGKTRLIPSRRSDSNLPVGPQLSELSPMLLDERIIDLSDPEWIAEIKHDGYRMLGQFGDGKPRLQTRNGADATKWFPEVAAALSTLGGHGRCVVDGEMCVLDELGRSDFDQLHERAQRRRWYPGAPEVVYCVFDLLVHAGKSVMGVDLIQRKALLSSLLTPPPPSMLYVGYFEEHADILFREAVLPLKLEGLVAKRRHSLYVPGARSLDWVKVKRKGAVNAQRFKRAAPIR